MIRGVFKNNGVARGWLYFQIAILTVVVGDITTAAAWIWNNADKIRGRELDVVDYTVIGLLAAKTILSAILAGFLAVRAYLDQHLSKPKEQAGENP